jgi:transcriptional regulator with XRE-family HTH domain
MPRFSERLKETRQKNGITQKQIAGATGISISIYQEYEYGTAEPTASRLEVLARYLNVSTDYLLGLDDVPNRKTQ